MLASSSIKSKITWKCVKVGDFNKQGINDFEFSYVRVMVCCCERLANGNKLMHVMELFIL
jgi:hypothetical protein